MNNVFLIVVGIVGMIIMIRKYLISIPRSMIYNKYSLCYYVLVFAFFQVAILFGIVAEQIFNMRYGEYLVIFSIIVSICGIHGISIITIKITAYLMSDFYKRQDKKSIEIWTRKADNAHIVIKELKRGYMILFILSMVYVYYNFIRF